MYNVFVKASNYERLTAAIEGMGRRGAGEATWVLVAGEPGLGKTASTTFWALSMGAIMVRLTESSTPTWVLTDIVNELGGTPRGSAQQLTEIARDLLADDPRPIVIDEADHGLRQRCRALEAVRNISDQLEIAVVLAGRETLIPGMRHHQQFLGRVAPDAVAIFKPASVEDVRKFREAKTRLDAEPGVDQAIHGLTGGYTREIMHALALLEVPVRQRDGRITQADVTEFVKLKRDGKDLPAAVAGRTARGGKRRSADADAVAS